MIGMYRFGYLRVAPATFDGTYPLPAGERAAGHKAVESKMEREPVFIEPRSPAWEWVEPKPPFYTAGPFAANPFRPIGGMS